ncbi:MAG: rhamnogalacturonan acetylesterase [Odoribacter sp.]|nr:rhamnogalacturonan acetylesterase [Odoribacter sp.]
MKGVFLILGLFLAFSVNAQELFKFDFTEGKAKKGFIKVNPSDGYNDETGYGYDLIDSYAGENKPFFFSVKVPDGNYRVRVTLGSKKEAGETTIRGESRRLFIENIPTRKGELKEEVFVINKRNTHIAGNEYVRIKPRERSKLNWDDKLTLEFNGDNPQIGQIVIEKADDVITVFLCGNSTVVDQDNEPWGSWGQMIPRFFNDKVCFANYAESGESANSFIAAHRLKKALTQMKKGDYIFVEFGHNDQKQKGEGKGAYLSFTDNLKKFIEAAREKEAHIVVVTPTQRRSFDENGKIKDTHEDYPDAMRKLAREESIPIIDLHAMTRTLYEALGVENSKKAFVHYPANTYPGQTTELADNTHFNPYGAYQIAQCVIEGLKQNNSELVNYLREDYKEYNPARPDSFNTFKWNLSPFTEIEKPDGN